MTADALAYKLLQNVIQGKRGCGRAGVGRTKLRTFLPMLLDRTIVTVVKWGSKNMLQGCTRMAIIGSCICSIAKYLEHHTVFDICVTVHH